MTPERLKELTRLVNSNDPKNRIIAASSEDLPVELQEVLSKDEDEDVKYRLMHNPSVIFTLEKIEKLKQSWLHDPCWDIEDTEGFEAHKQELYIFRLETELKYYKSVIDDFKKFRKSLIDFISDK